MDCDDIIDKTKLLINDIVDNPVIRLQQETVTGAGLAQQTYKIRVTTVSLFGETDGCAYVSDTISENNKVLKISIGKVKNATKFRVYASVGTDEYTLQGEASITQQGVSLFTLSSYTTSGSVLPTKNTATEYLRHELYKVAVDQALSEYSRVEPREVVEVIPLTTETYVYDLPVDWVNGSSRFIKAYWVRDGQSEEVNYANITITDTGITLSNFSPVTNDTLRFYYTIPYKCTTIPIEKITAFSMLCASYACIHIATGYSHSSNRQIGAEVVNFDMRASDFRKMAEMYRQQAMKMLTSCAKSVFARWSDL